MLLRSLILLLVLIVPASAQTKRPLKHTDADSWRTISSPQLSRNGQYAAYAVMPQEGDGEYVVRNLATAQEWRLTTGGSAISPGTFSSRPSMTRGVAPVSSRLAFT